MLVHRHAGQGFLDVGLQVLGGLRDLLRAGLLGGHVLLEKVLVVISASKRHSIGVSWSVWFSSRTQWAIGPWEIRGPRTSTRPYLP